MRKWIIILTVLAACNDPSTSEGQFRLAGNALGTTYHITYIGDEHTDFPNSLDSMIEVMNHSLSTYQSNSFISRFNSNDTTLYTGEGVTDADLYHFRKMLDLSVEVSAHTQGAFDPSAAPLFACYDVAKRENRPMDAYTVDSLRAMTGIDQIIFDNAGYPKKVRTGLQLNFNAIAKGYLVDIVADYLDELGIEHYMVEIGGEVRVKGKNSENSDWRMGINYPAVGHNGEIFEVLDVSDIAIATSGNYQNYYYVNDSLIGHTIDPRTGEPIINQVKSASVLHARCAVADAYATAIMVLGADAIPLLEADTSLQAFIVVADDKGELSGKWIK